MSANHRHRIGTCWSVGAALLLGASISTRAGDGKITAGPGPGLLRVCPSNPGYFQDTSTGKAVFLHGHDHFRALQEVDNNGIPPLDFEALITQLRQDHENFLRLWAWEHFWRQAGENEVRPAGQTSVVLPPHVYQRTGPGAAVDGKPKFDLHAFDQAYFDRLRQRVIAAGESGIWVSVMLFQGWSIYGSGSRANSVWKGHPMNAANNVNGVDGDLDRDGHGWEVHTRANPAINELHDAYVRKVIDTVGDLDNVLYEISNESVATSDPAKLHAVEHVRDWAYHLIELIHRYEREKGVGPHPVGISDLRPLHGTHMSDDWNVHLFASPAEYVSPNGSRWTGDLRWKKDPPAATGAKVIIADTDHIHPSMHGGPGTRSWQWRAFTRGHCLNLVDGDPEQGADWVTPSDSAAMQAMTRLVDRTDLARMRADVALSTTTYCLADPGQAYIVYQPRPGPDAGAQGHPFELSVRGGNYRFEWLDAETGRTIRTGEIGLGVGRMTFTPPCRGHAVLFLTRNE